MEIYPEVPGMRYVHIEYSQCDIDADFFAYKQTGSLGRIENEGSGLNSFQYRTVCTDKKNQEIVFSGIV